MKTASDYILNKIGTKTFERALELKNIESIKDFMNDFAAHYAKQIPIFRICSSCNCEFQLLVGQTIQESFSTFQNCDHCGKRNDTWISIKHNH